MIFKKMSWIVAAGSLSLLASLLTGCVALDETNSGYIAGSIGVNMTTINSSRESQRVDYRSLDGRHQGSVAYIPSPLVGNLMADIKQGDFRGTTFFKRLPTGEYSFTGNSTSHTGMGPMVLMTFQDREMAGGQFTVYPGKVTYVGAWEATPVVGKNLLGMDYMVDATFRRRFDREIRDMAIIAKKQGGTLPAIERKGKTPGPASTGVPSQSSSRSTASDSGTEYLTP